jgi:membrane protein
VRAELTLIARALWRGTVRFYNSDDLTFAASIAYYALLSLFPFFLVAFSVLGAVSAGAGERAAILDFVFHYFPRQLEFVTAQLDALAGSRVQLGVLGSILVVWAAMGVFGAVTSGVNYAWGVPRPHGYFKHKAVSFLMLVAAGILLIIALLIVSAVQLVRARWFAAVPANMPGLLVLQGLVFRYASLVLFVAVVGLIYYFVTNTKVRFRDVWVGAIVTGLLWQGALAAFSWYVRDLSRYRLIHGSIAAVVVFLIWVYLSSAILLLGAEISGAYSRLRESRL